MIKNYSFYNFIFFKKGEVKMKNKFMRSVTAMVVAVTMLISSQGVVTSFADVRIFICTDEGGRQQRN